MNNEILLNEFNLSEEQLQQFYTYYNLLITENEKINLTGGQEGLSIKRLKSGKKEKYNKKIEKYSKNILNFYINLIY